MQAPHCSDASSVEASRRITSNVVCVATSQSHARTSSSSAGTTVVPVPQAFDTGGERGMPSVRGRVQPDESSDDEPDLIDEHCPHALVSPEQVATLFGASEYNALLVQLSYADLCKTYDAAKTGALGGDADTWTSNLTASSGDFTSPLLPNASLKPAPHAPDSQPHVFRPLVSQPPLSRPPDAPPHNCDGWVQPGHSVAASLTPPGPAVAPFPDSLLGSAFRDFDRYPDPMKWMRGNTTATLADPVLESDNAPEPAYTTSFRHVWDGSAMRAAAGSVAQQPRERAAAANLRDHGNTGPAHAPWRPPGLSGSFAAPPPSEMQPPTDWRPPENAEGLDVQKYLVPRSSSFVAGASPPQVGAHSRGAPLAAAPTAEEQPNATPQGPASNTTGTHLPFDRLPNPTERANAAAREGLEHRDAPAEHVDSEGANDSSSASRRVPGHAYGADNSAGSSAQRSQLSVSDIHVMPHEGMMPGDAQGSAATALTRSNVALHRPQPEKRVCARARDLLAALIEEPLPENATNAELLAALEDSDRVEESLECVHEPVGMSPGAARCGAVA